MRLLFPFALLFIITSAEAQEHSVYRVASLSISGSSVFSEESIAASFATKQGGAFQEAILENDINTLLARYADAGYTLAKVTIAHITARDSVSLDIFLVITEGKRSRIGRIDVSGLSSTDTEIVAREIRLASGGYYRKADIGDAAARLRHLGIFSSISEPEYYIISDSTVGVTLTVTEARTTSIDGIIGYIPAITPSQKGYINGFAALDFRNIGGTARRASFSYKHEAPRVQDISAAYREPWLFGIPLDLGVNFAERDEDSLFTRIGFGTDLTAHLSSTIDIAAQGGYVSTVAGPAKLVSGNHALTSNLSLHFDHRDNIFAPRKGFDLTIGGGVIAKKITSQSIYDSAGQTATTLTQYSIDGSLYIPTFSRNQIFVAAAHGRAFDAGDKTPDRSDLYHVGGARSLRGFRESEFLVSFYIIGTVEYRFMLSDLSYIGIFADGASLASKGNSLPRTHPIGYGISLQFETAAGILSASVAAASGDPIDQAKLHFGIASAF